MENKLQEAIASIQNNNLLNIRGNTVSLKDEKSASGTLSFNGEKFLLNISGQEIELGKSLDNIALDIMKSHLSNKRALGN